MKNVLYQLTSSFELYCTHQTAEQRSSPYAILQPVHAQKLHQIKRAQTPRDVFNQPRWYEEPLPSMKHSSLKEVVKGIVQ